MRKLIILSLVIVIALPGWLGAQIKVTSAQKLAIAEKKEWAQPKFSPDGKKIYFSSIEYTLETKTTRKITDDPRCGFGFSISHDGSEIIYRRTYDEISPDRQQEIVVINLSTGTEQVVNRGTYLSPHVFLNMSVVGSGSRNVLKGSAPAASDVAVIGIDNQKIQLFQNGKINSIDPLGNGSYIWPVLSPDKKYLMAYEMEKGTFIADLSGKVLKMIGRCDAARWSRDGRWIFYTVEKNDGHQITGSDIFYRSLQEEAGHLLLDSPSVSELSPDCSPVDNVIVCSTLDGSLILIRYEEVQQ
jgi:Tol biopolymer transport system component